MHYALYVNKSPIFIRTAQTILLVTFLAVFSLAGLSTAVADEALSPY